MVISYVFCILISLLLLAVLGRVDDYVVYIYNIMFTVLFNY